MENARVQLKYSIFFKFNSQEAFIWESSVDSRSIDYFLSLKCFHAHDSSECEFVVRSEILSCRKGQNETALAGAKD